MFIFIVWKNISSNYLLKKLYLFYNIFIINIEYYIFFVIDNIMFNYDSNKLVT